LALSRIDSVVLADSRSSLLSQTGKSSCISLSLRSSSIFIIFISFFSSFNRFFLVLSLNESSLFFPTVLALGDVAGLMTGDVEGDTTFVEIVVIVVALFFPVVTGEVIKGGRLCMGIV